MAFVQVIPVTTKQFISTTDSLCQSSTSSNRRPITVISMAGKPEPPASFKKPDPRRFYVRSDKLLDVASLSLGSMLRLGSGAFVEGYKVELNNESDKKKLDEYSSTLPKNRPEKPLYLFQFEACPFCRKVREAISILDIDVIIFPTPKNGKIYRQYVKTIGGKSQFPYLQDPNTDFSSYESDIIIKYLYETYGPSSTSINIPFTLSSATLISAGIASSILRAGKGRQRYNENLVPSKKIIELWSYETSPFCKLVNEVLNDLEIAYLLHTTARGSPTRQSLIEMTGRFQVPYMIDQNTGINMWESAEIIDYLIKTYGPDSKHAINNPTENDVFMPGDTLNDSLEVEELPSLDPQPIKDEKLEAYCEDNPDADECRVYED